MARGSPTGTTPSSPPALPPAIASPQPLPSAPSRQTPRRAAIGWRAGPMAGPLLGRVGPGRTWRGGRGARAGTAAAGGRAPSTCPRPVRVSGSRPCVPVLSVCPAVSARPHPAAPATRTGRYAAVPAPWPRGRLRTPKPRGFASESARPLPPGGRGRAWGREGGDSDVSECCGLQPCPGGLQQAGG